MAAGMGCVIFFDESDVHLPQPPKKSNRLLILFYFIFIFIDFLIVFLGVS
jgi:hypothetical protein